MLILLAPSAMFVFSQRCKPSNLRRRPGPSGQIAWAVDPLGAAYPTTPSQEKSPAAKAAGQRFAPLLRAPGTV